MLAPDGRIAGWNKGAEALLGYAPSDVIGKHLSCLWPSEDAACQVPAEAIECALREGLGESEGWCARRDGSRFWASTILCALRDPAGHRRGFSAVIQDVTARKQLVDEVLANEDAERQRVGGDLHDVVGQDLAAVALMAQELEERLSDHRPADAQLAAKVTRCANRAMDHVRRLSAGMCALRLETGGLSTALEQLALDIEQVFDVSCRLELLDLNSQRDPLTDLHLYRIAQEAVTNAIKHGRAHAVRIRLKDDQRQYTLRIEDDGTGLPDDPTMTQGLGTSIMRHRARMIGGHLRLHGLSPRGTVVSCTVPNLPLSQSPEGGDGPLPP
jgi:two-component system CheB/CheR fusion protein